MALRLRSDEKLYLSAFTFYFIIKLLQNLILISPIIGSDENIRDIY